MRVPSRSMLMPCFVVLGAALLGGALFFAHEKARPGKGTAEATSQVRALAATATHASAWQVPSPAAQSAVTSTVARPAVRVALAPPASASAPIAASRARHTAP